ncbi:MAG: hypothetical protein KBC95_02780 [Candidatus Peribacteraceae bacterium]|nr:hypothetical protein [Candidatus Peribacteraceae bacterium]
MYVQQNGSSIRPDRRGYDVKAGIPISIDLSAWCGGESSHTVQITQDGRVVHTGCGPWTPAKGGYGLSIRSLLSGQTENFAIIAT